MAVDSKVQSEDECGGFLLWQGMENNSFSTKVMYDKIVEASTNDEVVPCHWSKLWWKVISTKISAFSWKVVRERLSTKDNLRIHGVFVGMGDGVCSMCFGPLASSNNVLCSCLVVLLICKALSYWLDKPIPCASSIRDHYAEFVESEKGKKIGRAHV